MSSQDLPASYGSVSRFNHWIGAIVVITMLAIGLYFGDLPRGDEKLFWMKLHISIGATAFAFIVFRLIWRLMQGFPAPLPQDRRLQKLTHAVHGLLLAGLTILIFSGPVIVWTGGRAIEFFGLFAIPSPTGEMKQLHEALEGVHGITAKIMIFLIILHVAGAVKHLVMDREDFMGRMMGKRKT